MKAIHIQLADERGDVGVLEVRSVIKVSDSLRRCTCGHVLHRICLSLFIKYTYDSTFEKSAVGDMTKLSEVGVHDIKCWMLESSSMLSR